LLSVVLHARDSTALGLVVQAIHVRPNSYIFTADFARPFSVIFLLLDMFVNCNCVDTRWQ